MREICTITAIPGNCCIKTLKIDINWLRCHTVWPNGLLACGINKKIKILDTKENFKCLHTLNGHEDEVRCLAILPDGFLASASSDSTIKIWDPKQDFKCIHTLSGHSHRVASLAVLPDGRLASGSQDATIKIWNPKQDFKCIHTLLVHKFDHMKPIAMITHLTLSPNGSLISSDNYNTIKIWDPKQDFKCIQTLKGISAYSLKLLPNGCLACGNANKTITILDPKQDFKCIQTLKGVSWKFAMLPNGSLVTGSEDNTIKIWRPKQLLRITNATPIKSEIRKAITSLQKVTLSSEDENLSCPICLEVFNNPTVTNCGHTFCKDHITKYLADSEDKCPCCRTAVKILQSNYTVSGIIDSLREKKSHVPSFSLYKEENEKLKNHYRNAAKILENEEEYEEALAQYSPLLKYSKEWKDYAHIPRLMEKLGKEKAVITYLYLAQYQVEAKAYKEALETLKKAAEKDKVARAGYLRCKPLLSNGKKAAEAYLALAKESKGSQAIDYCHYALKADPLHLMTYHYLTSLLPNPHQKAHTLITAALHCIRAGDLKNGQVLCEKAYHLCPKDPLIHHLPYLRLLLKQNKTTQAKKLYLTLANVYTENKQLPDRISCYKNLLSFDQSENYYKEIISAYRQLGNERKALRWHLKWINTLIANKQWEKAETIANAALDRNKKLPIFQSLETIYTHWQGHKLSDLWMRLGSYLETSQQIPQAETIYRKAYDRFHEAHHTIALAKILTSSDKVSEGVNLYYQAANTALLKGDFPSLTVATEAIRTVDPTFSHLSETQRTSLIQNFQIVKMNKSISTLTKQVNTLMEEKNNKLITKDKIRKIELKKVWIHKAHTKSIQAFAVMPDGLLASASGDGTIVIWDTKVNFKYIQTLQGHSDYLRCLAVLPDGTLASGSDDKTIKIWDPKQNFKCVQTLEGHSGHVYNLTVLPNGYLASACRDGFIKIWDPKQNFKCIHTLKADQPDINDIAVLSDGSLACVYKDSTFNIWDPKLKFNFRCIHASQSTIENYSNIILPNGFIASNSYKLDIAIWNPKQRYKSTQILHGHTEYLTNTTLLSNGCIASASRDKTIKIWDPMQGYKCIQTLPFKNYGREVHSFTLLPDGSLVSGFNNGSIIVWG